MGGQLAPPAVDAMDGSQPGDPTRAAHQRSRDRRLASDAGPLAPSAAPRHSTAAARHGSLTSGRGQPRRRTRTLRLGSFRPAAPRWDRLHKGPDRLCRFPALKNVDPARRDQVRGNREVQAAGRSARLLDDLNAGLQVRLALCGLYEYLTCDDDYGSTPRGGCVSIGPATPRRIIANLSANPIGVTVRDEATSVPKLTQRHCCSVAGGATWSSLSLRSATDSEQQSPSAPARASSDDVRLWGAEGYRPKRRECSQ